MSDKGNLYGTVVDNQGSALPGVTLVFTGFGPPQVQVSNAQGQFWFLELLSASYKVEAQLEGFSSATQPANVHPGRETNIHFMLQPSLPD